MSEVLDTRVLRNGRVLILGKRAFAYCNECGKLVRVDKPLVGSLHYCWPKKDA